MYPAAIEQKKKVTKEKTNNHTNQFIQLMVNNDATNTIYGCNNNSKENTFILKKNHNVCHGMYD